PTSGAGAPECLKCEGFVVRLLDIMQVQASVGSARWPLSRALGSGVLALACARAAALAPAPGRAQGLPDFTDLVERVGPAVVNIRTTERVRAGRGGAPEMGEDLLRLFRRFRGASP